MLRARCFPPSPGEARLAHFGLIVEGERLADRLEGPHARIARRVAEVSVARAVLDEHDEAGRNLETLLGNVDNLAAALEIGDADLRGDVLRLAVVTTVGRELKAEQLWAAALKEIARHDGVGIDVAFGIGVAHPQIV